MKRHIGKWVGPITLSVSVFVVVFVALTLFMVRGANYFNYTEPYQPANPLRLGPAPPVRHLWMIELHPGQHILPIVIAAVWALVPAWPILRSARETRSLQREAAQHQREADFWNAGDHWLDG